MGSSSRRGRRTRSGATRGCWRRTWEPAMLTVSNLHAGYGRTEILHGVDLRLDEGEIVALIGPNGAGKTTTLRTISGLHRASSGTVTLNGEDITSLSAAALVRRGMVHCPEGRELFPNMSVRENLRLGAYAVRVGRDEMRRRLRRVYDLFPVLAARTGQAAGSLSGGEQQMLAIGRALMAEPKLLLLDEPSLGLAPLLVAQMFDLIRTINQQ